MARRIDAARNAGPSSFTGFLMDKVAFSANSNNQLIEEDVSQYTDLLQGLRTAVQKKIDEQDDDLNGHAEELKDVLASLFDAIEATIQEGRLDLGAVVSTDNDALNLAAGFHVSDPSKIEQALKKVVAAAEQEDSKDLLTVNMNASSHQGVQFHEMIVAIPEDEEEARQVLGDQLVIQFGIGQDAVYVGFGSDPMPLITTAMDGSQRADSTNAAMEWNLFLAPILRFASKMDGAQMAGSFADVLEENGRDRIQITSGFSGTNGMKTRFEVQDGILSLIGQAMMQMQQGMGGPPPADF